MKTKLIAFGLIAVLAAGGTYGYSRHARSELLASISPSIKNATIRVTNTAKLETEKSNITFTELFNHVDADTSEIDKRLVEIQSLGTKDNADVTSPAAAYLRDCEEFGRAFAMKYRKQLALSSAIKHAQSILAEPMPSSSYGFEGRRNRGDRSVKDMEEAAAEANAASTDLVAAAKHLKESRSKLTNIVPDDTLVENAQLDAIIKSNTPDPTKKNASKKAAG